MQKFLKALMLVALMAVPWALNAQNTLTVADGTTTNSFVPVYGYYADAYLRCQIIYPASEIAASVSTVDMDGGSITGMTFYATQSSVSLDGTWEVKLMEVSATTLSSFQDMTNATTVYTGTVGITSNEMSITFDSTYTYNGGNLMVEFTQTSESSSYPSTTFYGVSATGASVQGYSYSSVSSISASARDFIPKTTFTFTGGTAVTCPAVQSYTVSAVDSNSATITWVDSLNSGATYTINYWANGGSDTLTTTVSDTTVTLTGLNTNTTYYYTIQVVCSASDNSVTLGGSFKTTCGTMVLPYTADFEDIAYNGAWPSCWNLILNYNTDPSVNYNANHTTGGTYSMYMQAYYSYNMFASSAVPLAGNNIYVRFWAKMSSNSSTWMKAGVMTDLTDTSTFIPLVTINGGNTNWTEYEFTTDTLDANATYYVAWLGYGVSSWSALGYVDDVTISEIPACQRVTVVTLDTATTDAITLSWVDNANSGATYTVSYWAKGSTDTLTTTASDTTVTITGLSASTAYNFIVMANCSGGDAEASPVFTFRTACGTATLPYFTDFEDVEYNGAWYPCWDSTIHAGTDPSVNNVRNHTTGGTYAMYLQAKSPESYNLVVGPEMNVIGNNIYCRFWAYLQTGSITAGVISNPNDTSTFVPLITVSGSGWNEYEFNTASLSSDSTYRVAWLAYYASPSTYGTQIGEIDDIYISEIPSCLRVSDLVVTATDSNSISIRWSDQVNSGATYTVMVGDSTVATGLTDTTYTVTDLEANTQYTIAVAVDCGSETSETQTVSGRTTCIGFEIPYVYDFEDANDEACWTIFASSSYTAIRYNTTSYSHDGSYAMRFYGGNNQYAVSPILTGTSNGVKVQFYTRGSYGGDSLSIGYCTISSTVDSDFVWDETIGVTTSYELHSVIFPAGTQRVAFKHAYAPSYYYSLYVDSVVFMEAPACMPVTQLYVDSNVTANSATIHWTAPESGTNFIVTLDDSTYYNVSDTSYTFTGLDARTTYTAHVATDCAGDTSEWRSVTFTTDCAGGSCDMTVSMADSYGDGWNGNSQINFYQNGTLVGSAKLSSGSSGTATVNVCTGIAVNWSWQTGSYDSEDSYVIYDGGGTELYNSATSGVDHSDSVANACPSCLTPTGLVASVVDSNELEFRWNYDANVDAYIVSFNNDSVWTVADSVYNAFGLDPNTAYTFSVIAICETGVDTSNARTITVKTACGQMALPYSETFEFDNQGDVPSCWTVVTAGYNGYPAIDNGAHTGNNALVFMSNSSNSMIASSAVPLYGDSIYVSFWANVPYTYSGTLEAGVMTNLAADSTFISLLTINTNGGYTRYEFNTASLTAYHDSTFYVAFRHTGTSSYYDASIDDINIRLDEGCMYPANVTTTTTSSSVALTWHNSGSANTFAVQYRVYGTTDWDTNGYTVMDTAYNLGGLDPATTYEIRVGTICGLDTMWTVVTAQTQCDALNLPYIENFVSADGTLPPCWDYTTPSYFHWNRWTTHAETSGDGELMAGSHSAGEYAILPEFNSSINKLQISFKAKLGNISEGDSMTFGVYDDYSDSVYHAGTMAISGQSRENFVVFTYAYTNYAGLGNRIAIGHTHNNSSDWGFAVDSIVVIQLPDCLPPTDVEAHNTLYPNTADDIYFTWTGHDMALDYQLYIDTITSTVDIDSVPDSLLITVDTNYYHVPFNTLAYGAHYRFFVRSDCGYEQSNWVELQNGFSTDEVWMNNTGVADTVTGCDFIVYDNGGPVAGYLHNSNSALVLISGDDGRELQIQGGYFSHGADANTLTVYDGIGTSGDVLYTRNVTNVTETIDSVLATSTTGAMTITFTSGYYAANGYELYIHCVGTAACERPTRLHAEMTELGEATVTWNGSSSKYEVYYKISDDTVWTVDTTTATSLVLTGLVQDTNYDLYVIGDCDSVFSTPSVTIQFFSYFEVIIDPCDGVNDVTASNVTTNSAEIAWVSDATAWEMEVSHIGDAPDTLSITTNPYTLTNLLPSMQYSVRLRSVCDGPRVEPYSDWSASVNFTTETPDPGAIEGVEGVCQLRLFPNPASSTVTVSFLGIEGEATVEIVDISGRSISRYTTNDNELTINISTLAQGAYFVRVTGEQATAVRRLIVK